MQKVKTAYLINHNDVGDMVAGYLKSKDPVCYDIETTGFDPYTRKLVSLQFKQFKKPVCILDTRTYNERQLKWIGSRFKTLFEHNLIVGMNLKFDWQWSMVKMGVGIKNVYDVMLAEQVIRGLGQSDAREQGVHFNLKAIAEKYDIAVSKEAREIFPDMDKKPEWNLPFSDETISYMAQDVAVLEEIYNQQQPLIEERGLELTVQIENGALPAIASMEVNGINIEVDGWRKFMAEKDKQAGHLESQLIGNLGEIIANSRREKFQSSRKVREEWETLRDDYLEELKDNHKAYAEAGGDKKWGEYKREHMKTWKEQNPTPEIPKLDESPMKLSSPAQVTEAFQKLGVTIEKTEWNRTKRRLETFVVPLDSTSSKVLGLLPEGEWPDVDMFRVWRKLYKFTTSFGETMLEKINPVTHRIHPNYVQIGASTGRMSCTNPNWQQVPSKGDGKKLRSLIRATKGNMLLTADFSNIELRILAEMSQDQNMLGFFDKGMDLHCETARMMFNLPAGLTIEEIKELKSPQGLEYRKAAKAINFGLVYGMSATGLMSQLRVTKQEAEALMKAYFDIYPGIATWLAEQARDGVLNLKSRTLAGRLRLYRLPDEYDPDYRRQRGSVERKAKNTPIQGTSADITKLALAYFYNRAPEYAKLVAVVHDELVVEVQKDKAGEVSVILGQAMDDACSFFLKTVALPPTVVAINEAWEKA